MPAWEPLTHSAAPTSNETVSGPNHLLPFRIHLALLSQVYIFLRWILVIKMQDMVLGEKKGFILQIYSTIIQVKFSVYIWNHNIV